MENVNLYQEMSSKIADLLLGCEDSAMCLYAGTYIKSLEEQLKGYKDLEEEGKLPKLPCAVGDRLFQINADEPSDIQSYTIDNIVIRENGEILFKHDSWDGVICDLDSLINGNKYLDCFRTFFTYEEAEAALKELEDKKL